MRLLFVRHAESQGNYEFRLQGRAEYPLTDLGQRQAAALAERLAGEPIAAVYSSPLARTLETAQIAGERLQIEVQVDDRLQEYDFGEQVSGLTWDEIREEHPEIIRALMDDDSEFPRYPGEEGRANFRDRVWAVVGEIAERHKDNDAVLVVTHAGPIAAYVMTALGRNYTRPIPFAIHNASLTIVEVNEPKAFSPCVVASLNDTCHLWDGLESARTRSRAATTATKGEK